MRKRVETREKRERERRRRKKARRAGKVLATWKVHVTRMHAYLKTHVLFYKYFINLFIIYTCNLKSVLYLRNKNECR